jgi:DNA repair protein RadC
MQPSSRYRRSVPTPWNTPMSEHPLEDRPRERLAAKGSAALSDAELVAIQLGSGSLGQSALALAQRMLADFGGVSGLARAEVVELARHPGVGAAKASRLVSAFALGDRLGAQPHRLYLRTSADIAAVAAPLIGRSPVEKVLLIVADQQSRVCRVLTVAHGGAASCMIPVREVLSQALRHDGVSLAVAHNHPSGLTDPSTEDRRATSRLVAASAEVGLRLLDHVIVTQDSWRSLTASS